MKTCFVGSAECLNQPILYSLITSVSEDGLEQYGVLVQYQDTQALIPDISVSREKTTALINLLLHGSVTPITARDVVEDWLATLG